MARFEKLFPQGSHFELIDVGGTVAFWEGTARRVTIINPALSGSNHATVTSVKGDGRYLPFRDKSFGLAFSNSAIEHLACKEDMRTFAEEMSRVGIGLYCQTPNRRFPFDVHYCVLFLHWCPRLLRNYYVARYLTGWGWTFKPDRRAVQEWADHVNLLTKQEFQAFFPTCSIEEERFLWIAKSFIAIRR